MTLTTSTLPQYLNFVIKTNLTVNYEQKKTCYLFRAYIADYVLVSFDWLLRLISTDFDT